MPVLTVFGGPNGSGKSSLIRQVEFEGRENLLEPDAIARSINPEIPQQAGISAGREVLRRSAEYLEQARASLSKLPSQATFLERHFTYLNYIVEWLQLPIEEDKRICKKVAKVMGMPESEMKDI